MVGETMPNNPLSGYFRQPAVYIRLPSDGKYWPTGTLVMPENGEIPVYPMTAMDEIAYRTPDALFNGDAVVRVIQSCIPAIKNAWATPSMDMNAILVGIRIASYGNQMEIDTVCPKCEANSTFSFDLSAISNNISSTDYAQPVTAGDLQIFFKPLSYKQSTTNSLSQFEEQKTVSMVENSEMSEVEKLKHLADAFQKVSHLGIKAVAETIHYIKTPDENVVDPNFIQEFLGNCSKDVFEHIRKHILSINEKSLIPPLHIKCDECEHEWEQPFTLDLADFFA